MAESAEVRFGDWRNIVDFVFCICVCLCASFYIAVSPESWAPAVIFWMSFYLNPSMPKRCFLYLSITCSCQQRNVTSSQNTHLFNLLVPKAYNSESKYTIIIYSRGGGEFPNLIHHSIIHSIFIYLFLFFIHSFITLFFPTFLSHKRGAQGGMFKLKRLLSKM